MVSLTNSSHWFRYVQCSASFIYHHSRHSFLPLSLFFFFSLHIHVCYCTRYWLWLVLQIIIVMRTSVHQYIERIKKKLRNLNSDKYSFLRMKFFRHSWHISFDLSLDGIKYNSIEKKIIQSCKYTHNFTVTKVCTIAICNKINGWKIYQLLDCNYLKIKKIQELWIAMKIYHL